jgi:formyltetrahydrofolate deformylase
MTFPILRVACRDRPGLVHDIAHILSRAGANIVRNDEFVDRMAGRFFMRTEFENIPAEALGAIEDALRQTLPADAALSLGIPGSKTIVILATKDYHCLGDLLLRHHFGELNARIAAVISNHAVLGDLAARFGVPFHHIPHEGATREAHENALLQQLDACRPDYIVLAKYMRILSPGFVARYAGRMINIHHSFLPAFIGARPYHQAHLRGVKMIGATAHFVTDQLDEGPIIVQDITAVGHGDDPAALTAAGREVETQVLARALKLVLGEQVFIDGCKTVVFS